VSPLFQAKFPGRCGECESHIAVGETVTYNDDDELVHHKCKVYSMDEFTLGPRETICPKCFCIHAGGCA
jgi:hypothetical protein